MRLPHVFRQGNSKEPGRDTGGRRVFFCLGAGIRFSTQLQGRRNYPKMSMYVKTTFVSAVIALALLTGCGKSQPPPLGAEVRYGFLSDSVLQLYNSSHERLNATVVFTSRNGGDKITRSYSIPPLSKYEIGALEAPWNFEAGETAVISVNGYSKRLLVKLSADGKRYNTWYE